VESREAYTVDTSYGRTLVGKDAHPWPKDLSHNHGGTVPVCPITCEEENHELCPQVEESEPCSFKDCGKCGRCEGFLGYFCDKPWKQTCLPWCGLPQVEVPYWPGSELNWKWYDAGILAALCLWAWQPEDHMKGYVQMVYLEQDFFLDICDELAGDDPELVAAHVAAEEKRLAQNARIDAELRAQGIVAP
jgi:hypothetical protein